MSTFQVSSCFYRQFPSMEIPLRNDWMHFDDVQCSASCWLLIISTITTVIQLIKSSANLRHHLMGRGGGGEGGWEERRGFSSVKLPVVANWQILKSVVLFWSLNFWLTFITATTYLPTLEGGFQVQVNKMSKFLNSIPFSFPRSGKVYSTVLS